MLSNYQMNIKKNKKNLQLKRRSELQEYLHSVYPINTVFISFLQKIEITTGKTY